MKLQIFSILDNAIKAYVQPMYFRTRLEAIRSFSDAVNREGSDFARHSADYHLMYLGEFDDNDATFDPVVPERVISATECLADLSVSAKAHS